MVHEIWPVDALGESRVIGESGDIFLMSVQIVGAYYVVDEGRYAADGERYLEGTSVRFYGKPGLLEHLRASRHPDLFHKMDVLLTCSP